MATDVRPRLTLPIVLLASCTRVAPVAPAPAPVALHLHAISGARLGVAPRTDVRNANGSVRVTEDSAYAVFWRYVQAAAPSWAGDPRIDLNPNYVAALLLKESGADSLAVSPAPALGYAQLTASADADLRAMVTAPAFAWMRAEVEAWPRSPIAHAPGATKGMIDSLLRAGQLSARDEYLFDPTRSLRAAAFWLRLLENKWTSDDWPGGYGTFARRAVNGGTPLTEAQLFDLVTVSYNRGYVGVHALVARHGSSWTTHLDEFGSAGAEAADYLERVRTYTLLFENRAGR
jgi:hypothetical protein